MPAFLFVILSKIQRSEKRIGCPVLLSGRTKKAAVDVDIGGQDQGHDESKDRFQDAAPSPQNEGYSGQKHAKACQHKGRIEPMFLL